LLRQRGIGPKFKIFAMAQLILLPIVAFVFFYLGKHQERIEWNKLIKDGILPKPSKTK